MSRVVWVVQALLALLFLWAGAMKLVLPLENLAGPVSLPGPSCGSSGSPRRSARSA